MHVENATVVSHRPVQGDYSLLTLQAPAIAAEVRPGQFVHLRVPNLGESVLRRPFSVFKTEPPHLSLLYKCVGKGTTSMTHLRSGDSLSLLGPLGNGFPAVRPDRYPVLIAGGYGVAALYGVARNSPVRGTLFVGGATAGDILCLEEFEALNWDIRVATQDGSLGDQGLVTRIVDAWLTRERGALAPDLYACGPLGLLRAVCERAKIGDWTAWLSFDRKLGCGVGACLACVTKVRGETKDKGASSFPEWKWARICTEGPVFECRDILWEDHREELS